MNYYHIYYPFHSFQNYIFPLRDFFFLNRVDILYLLVKFSASRKQYFRASLLAPSGKESACLCRRHPGSIPDAGRSHMPRSNKPPAPQLLSLCSRAWEPQLPSPCAATTETCKTQSLCSATREAGALQLESSPRSPQLREKPEQQGRPSTAKNKQIFLIKKKFQH